jgi:hypothetical protein
MTRNITVHFSDGTAHQYNNAPDDFTPDQVEARTKRDYPNKKIVRIDGGKKTSSWSDNSTNKKDTNSPETYKNADWEISCNVDKLSDKKECTIFMKSNRRVQCNPEQSGGGTLFVGTPSRQTPSLIYTRFDNEPASTRLPEPMEKKIYATQYPLNQLNGKNRLRVRIVSILQDTYDYDINLSTLTDAIQQYLKIN